MRPYRILLLVITLALPCSVARALTDEEVFREFQFNFRIPGARGLGMGGAFVATADDATAAEANPAALRYLIKPEFFVEYRGADPSTRFSEAGVGNDDLPMPELPFFNLTVASSPETSSGVSFASVSWPLSLGPRDRRLNLAFSRHVVLDQNTRLATDSRSTEARMAFEEFPVVVNPQTGALEQYSVGFSISGENSMRIAHWNASAAFEIHPTLSVGITATYAEIDIAMTTETVAEDPRGILSTSNPRIDADQDGFFEDIVVLGTAARDSDSELTYSLGLHWRPDALFGSGVSPFQFGIVYHKGESFVIEESVLREGVVMQSLSNIIPVPDRWAFGVSYKRNTAPFFTIGVDFERIEYSDTLNNLNSGVNALTNEEILSPYNITNSSAYPQYDVQDANVPHFGVEYLIPLKKVTVGILAGFYNSPDHRMRMSQFNSLDPAINATYLEVFGGGEDRDYYTTGFSVKAGATTLQAGASFSDDRDEFLVNLVYRPD